jgi:hypothetical protein
MRRAIKITIYSKLSVDFCQNGALLKSRFIQLSVDFCQCGALLKSRFIQNFQWIFANAEPILGVLG